MIITYKEWSVNINDNLINDSNENDIYNIYIKMFKIFEKSKNNLSISEKIKIVQDIENTEYKMQELFGFDKNKNYHKYWNEIPNCTCSSMDNRELLGLELRRIDLNCPFHGIKIINILKRKDKLKRLLKNG